jgi:hypothetical protein
MGLYVVNGISLDETVVETRLNRIASLSGRNIIVYDDLTVRELSSIEKFFWVICCAAIFRRVFFGADLYGSRTTLIGLHAQILNTNNDRLMVVYQNALTRYNRTYDHLYIHLNSAGAPIIHRTHATPVYHAPRPNVHVVNHVARPQFATATRGVPVVVGSPAAPAYAVRAHAAPVAAAIVARPSYTPPRASLVPVHIGSSSQQVPLAPVRAVNAGISLGVAAAAVRPMPMHTPAPRVAVHVGSPAEPAYLARQSVSLNRPAPAPMRSSVAGVDLGLAAAASVSRPLASVSIARPASSGVTARQQLPVQPMGAAAGARASVTRRH